MKTVCPCRSLRRANPPRLSEIFGHADLSLAPLILQSLPVDPTIILIPRLRGSPSEWGLGRPTDVSWNNENLWVADFNNNRVIRFSTRIANPSDTDPEIFTAAQVMGQVDFTHTYSNRIDGRSIVAPQILRWSAPAKAPTCISSDRLTHRVMVHTLADRAANGASADAETLAGSKLTF